MSTSNVVGYDGNSTQEHTGRDRESRGEQGELLRAKRQQNQHHEQKLKQNTHLHPIPNFFIMSQSSSLVRVWLMADGWLQGFVLDGNSEAVCRGRGGQEGEGCMRTK